MMASFTLMFLQRIRITARPFLVMQIQISQIKASAVQRRIRFTCYLDGCFACGLTGFGVLNLLENMAMVSPAFLMVLMVFAVLSNWVLMASWTLLNICVKQNRSSLDSLNSL